LADERGDDLAVGPARHLVEEERLLADQPSLADEEQLDARVVALTHDADHVLIDLLGRDDLLALEDLVERLHLVAQDGGPLELLLGGGGLHLLGQPPQQVLVLALQEALDVAHRAGVALARLPARAGRVAAMDRVLDAGPLEPAVDGDRARPQGKELAGEPERLPRSEERRVGEEWRDGGSW